MRVLQRSIMLVLLLLFTSGCASTGGNDPRDPLESFNRAMFSFNDSVDKSVLKPVAEGYRSVFPGFVRTGVTNFFSNLEDLWIAVNQLLQGKVEQGVSDGWRFAVNTTVGILGLFDVASEFGFDKHNEHFGQTLAIWGVGSGPYVVLPLFGSTTLRDGLSRFTLDRLADPVANVDHVPTRNTLFVERLVSKRSDLLGIGGVVEEAALDKYSFSRDAYLQRRESLIHDGNPPRSPRADMDSDESSQLASSRVPALARIVSGTYPTPALLAEMSANAAPTVVTDGEGKPVSVGIADAPLLTRSVGGL